jgi:PilZ domain
MPGSTVAQTRRHARIALPKGMYVAWYSGVDQQISRVQTLGTGGLFISASNPPPVGTNLRLLFELPGGSFQAEGVVRNIQQGNGMGVEFTKVRAQDRVLLKLLLKRLLQ